MSEEIKTYEDLENEFEKLFDSNCKNELSINSKRGNYKPNPVISFKPEYCLIALEPALAEEEAKKKKSGKTRELYIDLLFMQSFNNLLLHYCAYKFLCGEEFNYQITDVCKVPLTQNEIKDKKRDGIYKEWKDLLKQELKLLGDPKIISLGYTTESFIKDNNDLIFALPHYSKRNTNLYNAIYKTMNIFDEHKDNFETEEYNNLNVHIKDFVEKNLLPHIEENFKLKGKEIPIVDLESLKLLFNNTPIEPKHKVRYYVYKKAFSEIYEQKYGKIV